MKKLKIMLLFLFMATILQAQVVVNQWKLSGGALSPSQQWNINPFGNQLGNLGATSTRWNFAYLDTTITNHLSNTTWTFNGTSVTATGAELNLTHSLKSMAFADSALLKAEMAGLYVPQTRTINGYDLSTNRSLAYSDLTSSAINIGTNTITSGGIFGSGNIAFKSSATNIQIYRYFDIAHDSTNRGKNILFGMDDGAGVVGMQIVDKASSSAGYNAQYITFSVHEGHVFVGEVARLTEKGALLLGYTSDPTSGNKLAVNGNSYFNGTGTFTGSVTVGGGSAISKIITASRVYDCGSIAAGVDSTFSITCTGAVAGNPVQVGVSVAAEAQLIITAECTTNDVVTVRISNHGLVSAVDPVSRTYKVIVTNF